jgi:uroporphyrinogen decarboxylase
MTKAERLEAAWSGKMVDRVPVSLWRHFPEADDRAETLAEALVDFHRRFDLDFVKLMPSGVYGVEDWGCRIAYEPNPNGVKRCVEHAVREAADWARLRPLDVTAGALGREVRCARLVRQRLGDGAPILQTVFSPLTTARKLAGDRVFQDMLAERAALHAGLRTIADTTLRFARACLEAGADGLFFATQLASADLCDLASYGEFGVPYDLEVLDAARGRAGFTLLHLHGPNIYFELTASYQVDAVNWHDRRTMPSLSEALRRTEAGLAGGIDETGTLPRESPAAVAAEVRDAIRQTKGRRLAVAPG